jgi:plastocyanin
MKKISLLLTLPLVLAACGGSSSPAPAPSTHHTTSTAASGPATMHATVSIHNYMYMPMHLTVAKGATVTFHNYDMTAHTATALDGSFDTGTINPGQSATIHLTKAGTFQYKCLFHAFMMATITVT